MFEVLKSATFEAWFTGLRDGRAQARINARIRRLSLGNPGDVKAVGSGVSEMRIDYGPGYRVYYAHRGKVLVLICYGGDKRTQDVDIKRAIEIAKDWKGCAMATKRRTKETFSRWDAADYLKSDEDMAAYLQACLEEAPDDPAFIAAALGDVARARGMVQLAKKTGLTREGLYKALSKDGNPNFGTVLKVLHALRLKITLQAV